MNLKAGRKLQKMRTLVLYIFHELHENISTFLRRGVIPDENYTFVMICNNPNVSLDGMGSKNVWVLRRQNEGFDFGGWNDALGG